jgi:N-acetylglucosamine kinase-like BadF-type ATPase
VRKINMSKNEKYLLAVDGGGSKTEILISNLEGDKLYSILIGSSSHKAVGNEKVILNLQSGLSNIQNAGYKMGDIKYSVWGMSGCDSERDKAYFHYIIQKLGFLQDNYYLCNDSILAYYAQVQGPGMILIGGTGSISFGVTKEEQIFRIGGWGYGFSDCGGGYWIGNEVLKSTLLYADGLTKWDPLFNIVLSQSGSSSFYELGYIIADTENFSAVAQYAPLVFMVKDSLEGKRIIRESTKYMAKLGAAMYKKLGETELLDYNIVLSGGLFVNTEYYQEFTNYFCKLTGVNSQRIQLLEQSPCLGGIKIAMKRICQI